MKYERMSKGDTERYILWTIVLLILLLIVIIAFYSGAVKFIQDVMLKEFLK